MSRIQNKKNDVQHVTVDNRQVSRRIDNFLLSKFKKLPRKRVYQMLRRGEVRVNGKRVKQDYRLQQDDIVRIPPVSVPEPGQTGPAPEHLLDKIAHSLLYECGDFLVLNKPAGIPVHSGSGRDFGVIELLRQLRPGETDLQLVHRLDQETSGCLLLTKNMASLQQLHHAFKEGTVAKHYQALLKGGLEKNSVTIAQPLRKNIMRSGERLVSVDPDGKYALTRFILQQQFRGSCLTDVRIETGRTHQIRVHAAYLGNPVAGDEKYGDKQFNRELKKAGLRRLFLHAGKLSLPDTLPGLKQREFIAPLPQELADLLAGLVQ